MQKLRQNMPAVIIFLVVMFIALIIFEWGDASRGKGRLHTSNTAIAKVNGEEVSAAVYNQRVADIVKSQREAQPDADVDEERIREQMWNQMVDEVLIHQEAAKLGIVITDDELRENLFYDPPANLKQTFTDSTGTFLQAEYFDFLRNPRPFLTKRGQNAKQIDDVMKKLTDMQEGIRGELLRQSVESVITSTAIPSPIDAQAAFFAQKAKASGMFALIDATVSIPDSTIKVSDEDARKYYEDHKNDYQQKASREVRYALFNLTPSAADSAKVANNLRDAMSALAKADAPAAKTKVFEELATKMTPGKYDGAKYTPLQEISPELQSALQGAAPGTVLGPIRLNDGNYLIDVADFKDSGETYVKAQHILLRTTPTGNNDSVKAEAMKIYQRAKSGESFESLAREYSSDGSAQKGGDLGYFKKGAMVKEFDEAAFATPTGSISEPVKSNFGYHIIKVNDRSTRSYKLHDIRFDVKVSNITRNELARRATVFHDELVKGTPIDTLGKQQNIQILETGPIERLQPAAGSMKLTNFAYEGKAGDVSDVYDLANGSVVVGQLSKVHTDGLMSFDDAKSVVIAKIRQQKKLDMVKEKATKLRASLAPGDSLTKLGSSDPTVQVRTFNDVTRASTFPGVGYDFALTNAVFDSTLAPNQISKGIIRGDRGYYIVTVSNRTQPSLAEYETERPKFMQQFLAQSRQALYETWLKKTRDRVEIVDFRDKRF
ncbi:MAG: peptidyl-prolyl cis-trans isomerase [Candidatus Kapaibacterium sp.]